ncbi:MAG TPA: S9 family peptidase [Gemmataceae bacterium]|jgi:acylaminoacyl-peptidase
MKVIGPRPLGAVCLVLLAGAAARAEPPAADKLQPMDVFHLEYASEPQASPDGGRVAYVRNFMDVMKDKPRSHLWVINADGSDHRPLTSGDGNESSPRWSPDGKRLAYVGDAGGKDQLFVRWMDTGQTAQLTRGPQSPASPAWSPDGRQIAFAMFVEDAEEPFVEMPAKPEGAEWAKGARVIRKAMYRFDGKGYLKPGYWHLFVVPAEGGAPRQVTKGAFNHLQTNPEEPPQTPAWTPDGRHVLLSANRRPDAEYNPTDTEVYEVAVADGAIRPLTDRRGPDENPVVSPDGKLVAYLGYDDKHMAYQAKRLYVMNRDGTDKHVLAEALDREPQNPTWAKDGSGVYVQYTDRGNSKVALIRLDGRVEPLAENVGGTELGRPYASGSFSAAGGVVAYTVTSPARPADVAVRTPGSDKPRRLTSLNDGWLGAKALGAVEEFWFDAPDGKKIQGWVVKPPHFDPAKKYPLILEIHGGPSLDYGPYFTAEVQLYAAAGYVVVYTNPRGSTGYGEAFAQLINHNYPGPDYDDLMAGVDAVVKQGYVDPDNLFVTGGSGGGILTAWIVGKTGRFRAAVAAKAMVNMASAALTTDDVVTETRDFHPGPPWEQAEYYRKRSPLSLVGNVTTPTMLLTGEEDWRCPISEAEQFYAALKLRKVDTALVRIPEAGHTIVDRPSRMIMKVAHILKWFEVHRKAG